MGYNWLKLYSNGILRGSIVVQLSLEEQMTWIKLLCFASECRDRGIIRRAKGIPFEREQLAHHLGIPELLLNTTIEKCIKDENADDASTRIMVLPDGSLQIGNWELYQGSPEKRTKGSEVEEGETGDTGIVYTNDGKVIDEYKTIIYSQSLYKIRQILAGEIQATEANKERYRCELRRLGIE